MNKRWEGDGTGNKRGMVGQKVSCVFSCAEYEIKYIHTIYIIAYILFNIYHVAYIPTYAARVQKGDYLDGEKRQTGGEG